MYSALLVRVSLIYDCSGANDSQDFWVNDNVTEVLWMGKIAILYDIELGTYGFSKIIQLKVCLYQR